MSDCPRCGAPPLDGSGPEYQCGSLRDNPEWGASAACRYAAGLRSTIQNMEQERDERRESQLALMEQIAELSAERDRYRAALERIARHWRMDDGQGMAVPTDGASIAREALEADRQAPSVPQAGPEDQPESYVVNRAEAVERATENQLYRHDTQKKNPHSTVENSGDNTDLQHIAEAVERTHNEQECGVRDWRTTLDADAANPRLGNEQEADNE